MKKDVNLGTHATVVADSVVITSSSSLISQRERRCSHRPRVPAHERRRLHIWGIQVRERAAASEGPETTFFHNPLLLSGTLCWAVSCVTARPVHFNLLLFNPGYSVTNRQTFPPGSTMFDSSGVLDKPNV